MNLSNIHGIWIPQGDDRECRRKKVFEVIMMHNFQNWLIQACWSQKLSELQAKYIQRKPYLSTT